MTISLFGAVLPIDAGFVAVVLAVTAAGLARGFAGFGAALIMIPVASAVYGPTVAIPVLSIIDSVLALPFLIDAVRRCVWPEVAPILIAAMLGVPIGVAFLATTDPEIIRWVLCLFILAFVAVLAQGWRYEGRPPLSARFGIGTAAGLASGFTGIGGPPIILFWLGGQGDAATVRANVFVFFGLLSASSLISFGAADLLTGEVMTLSLVMSPIYALALWFGARAFRGGDERLFRRIALSICTLAAIIGLPALDAWLG